jgi:hypothetical protein
MADAAASKAAEATHVGSTPTFPTKKAQKVRVSAQTGNGLVTGTVMNLRLDNFRLVKLGPGLGSKNLWAMIAVEAALAVSLFATVDERIHVGIIVAMMATFFCYHIFNFVLIRMRPELALLEGAQLADYYRSSQGSIGMHEVADTPRIENPERRPQLSALEEDRP